MGLAQRAVSSQDSHLDALRAKHAALSARIEREQNHIATSDLTLKALKREKLKLKEAIQDAESSLH